MSNKNLWDIPCKVTEILSDFDYPWAICGGWAVDLYLEEVTREHKDIDIAINAKHSGKIGKYLSKSGWGLKVLLNGRYQIFNTQTKQSSVKTIWARRPTGTPRFIDVFMIYDLETLPLFYWKCESFQIPVLNPNLVYWHKKNHANSPYDFLDLENLQSAIIASS